MNKNIFMKKREKIVFPKILFSFSTLLLGSIWIFLNIFFLPFAPWTEGIHRPWLMLHGFVPYRDFLWNRGVFDLYLLSSFYKLFGVSEMSYRIIIFFLIEITSALIFFGLRKTTFIYSIGAYFIYVFFVEVLFMNAEIEEILVGLFSLFTFLLFWGYLRKKNLSYLLIAGIFTGFAFTVKQTSIVLMVISIAYLIHEYLKKINKQTWKECIKKIIVFIVGFILPLLLFLLFFLFNGMLDDYLYEQYFVLFIYSKWAKPWGIVDGMRMMGIFLSIIIPFIFFSYKKFDKNNESLLLVVFTLSLFIMLLPSYWSYRLVAALPLFSILLSRYIGLSYVYVKSNGKKIQKTIMAISFFIFFSFFWYFFDGYIQMVRDNGFQFGQLLLDYGENEVKTADWLKKHTSKNERIFNMANNIIMIKAERFPKNKYIDGMPIDYMPFEETYKDILSNIPNIVIYQESLTADYPELKNWQFINFLKESYRVRQKYGDIQILYLKPL